MDSFDEKWKNILKEINYVLNRNQDEQFLRDMLSYALVLEKIFHRKETEK